ncbi:MAG: S-layer homology domain-containing protein [Butyricicoccus pullicaecorum]|nr:S-layer homology domain-containing protein [Butyricicoccus pullicaecorum]
MRMQRYSSGRGRMPRRLTALFLATTMTVGTAPAAFASEIRRDVANSHTQTSSPVETVYVNSYTGAERTINFNDHWRFNLGDASGAEAPAFNDAMWQDVTLPHDYSIDQPYTSSGEAESGYLPGGVGWYRKTFTVDPSWKTTKRLSIHFDGVYMNAEVYLNGHKLGSHPYGYTAFSFELPADLLEDGENVLAVKVNNQIPSSRWYSGSGIYRDVTLTVTDPVHVAPNGVTVRTPDIEQNKGTVELTTKIANDSGEAAEGISIESAVLKKGSEEVIETKTTQVDTLAAGESTTVESSLVVSNPEKWNVWDQGDQTMYVVRTMVKKGDQVLDTYETEFGFRYFDFDQETGFSLNGEKMKLRGVCMHHDQGALGGEAWRRAIERQVEILKDMGCNAIRVTHNPAAQSLIEICNEQGMLVIDEAFDTWSNPKNGNSNDYAKHFKAQIGADNQIEGGAPNMTWAEFDIKSMVERGKNAPSVIMWSLGNEIFEGLNGGANYSDYDSIAQDLIDWVEEVDSTRPTTFGQNNNHGGNEAFEVAKVVNDNGGVVGLNYASEAKMTEWNKKGWKTYGSETASAINSRGVYEYKGGGAQTPNQLLTSYDKSAVNWGAVASDAWWRTIRFDYNAGEFVWTGFDYLGEPTPWNGTGSGSTTNDFNVAPKSSYFGIIDTTGFPKDSYYLYQSLWNDKVTTLHVLPTWDEKDVKKDDSNKVEVVVYSDAPVVKLYLNDKEIGVAKAKTNKSNIDGNGIYTYQTYEKGEMTKGATQENTFQAKDGQHQSLYATFLVPYERGKLTAKAFQEDGTTPIANTEGRHTVETTQGAAKLDVSADRTEITADGKDLSYITIDVEDSTGKFVNGAEPEISVEVTGDGKLLALDNGKQSDHTPYTDTSRNAVRGKLLAIVQSTNKSGEFTVTAKASGLEAGSETVTTTADTDTPAADNSVVSLEYSKNYYVKLGNQPELPTQLKVNYGEDKHEMRNVTWDTQQLDIHNEGISKVSGVLDLGGNKSLGVSVNVMMMRGVATLKNYSAAVRAGSTTANLPQVVPAVMEDGEVSEASFEVKWDDSKLDLNTPGTYVVSGTAQVFGQEMHPTATIRVSKGEVNLGGNVAKNASKFTNEALADTKANDLQVIRDGKKASADAAWTGNGAVKFGYDTAQNMTQVKLYLKGDVDASKIHVKWAPDSTNWQDVNAEVSKDTENGMTVLTYEFEMVSAEWMKLEFEEQVQLVESELYVGIPSFAVGATDKLESLKVGTYVAEQGALDNYTFNIPEVGATEQDVEAIGKDNASVTVLPLDSRVIRILTESEDHTKQGMYTIKLGNNNGNLPSADDDSKDYDYRKMTAYAPSWNEANGSDGPPSFAVNGNADDWWHSRYGEGEGHDNLSEYPEERFIQLELEEETVLNALRYLPRKGELNGVITKYYIEVSTDGHEWSSIAEGTWEASAGWKLAPFAGAVKAKYVRLYGMETKPENKFMTAAEIRVCVAEILGVESKIQSYEPIQVATELGQKPEMPETVKANMSTGQVKPVTVVWDEIPETQYNHVNKFVVEGTVEGELLRPRAHVVVRGVHSVDPVYMVAMEGFAPELPGSVTARFNDGTEEQLSVQWEPVSEKTGTVTISGEVTGTDIKASATIRFVEGTSSDENIALNTSKKNMPLAIGWVGPPNDNPFNATNGNKDFVSDGNKVVWTDWENGVYHADQNWMGVIFGSGSSVMPQVVERVSVGFMEEDGESQHKVKLPKSYKIEYYTGSSAFEYDASKNHRVKDWKNSPLQDEKNWTEVKYTNSQPTVPDSTDFKKMVDISFEPVTTRAIRISLTPQDQQWVGLEEFEVYGMEPKETLSSDFEVSSISLNGENRLHDFEENTLNVPLREGEQVPQVAVEVSNNAFVNVKQASAVGDSAVVYISPENGNAGNAQVYTINFVAEQATHTIRFESNGGSEVASVTVLDGLRVSEPEEPGRRGYVFCGWYRDAVMGSLYNFDAPVYDDLTLYAGWRESAAGNSSRPEKPEKPEKPEEKPEEKPDEKPEEKPSEPEQKPEAPKVDMIPTVPGNPEAIKAYGDVQAHWAQDAVAWAVTNKLFAGVSNTQFAPDSAMTRGMLATVLHRLAGQPALGQNQFADIPADAYYKNAVAWASQLGLVSGIGEGRFAPNSNITREQLAVILYKFAGSPAVSATELTFKDSAAISAWAQNAIAWAVQEGFLSGMSDGTLTPAGQATRAQVATILMRFEQKNHKAMPSANPVAAGPSI